MKYGLNILKNGDLDFVSLGALVNRLDPGSIPFARPPSATSMSAAANTTLQPTWQTVFV